MASRFGIVAHIAGNTAYAENTAFFIEIVDRFFGRKTEFLSHEFHRGGVYIARTRAHNESFERRKAHRRILTFSVFHGGYGRAVS